MANNNSNSEPSMLTNPTLLAGLTTEQRNPASSYIDVVSTEDMLKIVNAEDTKVAPAVALEIPKIAFAVDEIAKRMLLGGRLMYIGAGTSGRLGVIDASECWPTFNTSFDQVQGFMAGGDNAIRRAAEGVEDSVQAGRSDIISYRITQADTLVGVAASGRTPYVIGALDYAREIRAFTVGLACNKGVPMEQHVDVMISPVTGPEVITGSTRMKAGTATKLVLNMLSTGVMIRIGKTFGNLMIDMRPTNYKLEQRAVRIVMQALEGKMIDANGVEVELDTQKAAQLLNNCDKDVKVAILVGKTAMSPDDARNTLKQNDGFLIKAIKMAFKPTPIDVNSDDYISDEIYLAIDGGGTKTFAVVVNQYGRELGCGAAGSSNISTVGLDASIESIVTAVQHALAGHASLPGTPTTADHITPPPSPKPMEPFPRFQAIWIGLAGADRPAERAVLMPQLQIIFSATNQSNLTLSNDADLLSCSFVSAKRPGIALIGGTGSIAILYDANGNRIRRVGGWGYVLGDDGSGYAIGLAASKAVTRVLDGRDTIEELSNDSERSKSLFTRVMKYWSCETAQQYIPLVYGRDLTDADRKKKFSGLAQTVLEAYVAGDRTAACIIEQAAESLAELLVTCVRDFAKRSERQRLRLVMGGGLLGNWRCYRDLVLEKVARQIGENAFDDIIVAECPARMAAKALAKQS